MRSGSNCLPIEPSLQRPRTVAQGEPVRSPNSGHGRRENPTNKVPVKLVKATADYANEERDLEPNFDDKLGKKRSTGRIEFALDDKDETAWGIDAGPGQRNQDRKAVFIASTNVAFKAGTILTFHLKNNHGGWNSESSEQHRPLSLVANAARRGRSGPRVREVWRLPARNVLSPDCRRFQPLANDSPGFETNGRSQRFGTMAKRRDHPLHRWPGRHA